MNRIIYVDIDGTVNDTSEVIRWLYKVKTGFHPSNDYYTNAKDEVFMDIIHDGDFMTYYLPITNMVNLIEILEESYDIKFITHRGYSNGGKEKTMELVKQFPLLQRHEIIFSNPHSSKENDKINWLMNKHSDDNVKWCLIDDNPCYYTVPNFDYCKDYLILPLQNSEIRDKLLTLDLEKHKDNIIFDDECLGVSLKKIKWMMI